MTIEQTEKVSWHKPFSLHPWSIFAFIFIQFKFLNFIKLLFTIQNCSVRIKKNVLDTYNFIRAKLYFIFSMKVFVLICLHMWQKKYLFALFSKLDKDLQKWLNKCFLICIIILDTRKQKWSNKNLQNFEHIYINKFLNLYIWSPKCQLLKVKSWTKTLCI